MQAFRDTATVIWGDADGSVEEAAYKLRAGEVSPVIQAGDGYYIIKQTYVQTNGYYSGMAPDVLRERVVSRIRSRKEETRLNEFVQEFLKDKAGYARPEPLKLLTRSLMNAYEQSGTDTTISF